MNDALRDVVVVGAGPAGTTTAKLLAERGWRVTVVDRAAFPRTKACGESVNPGGVAELERLGLAEVVEGLPHRRVTGWRIHPRAGPPFEGRFRAGGYAMGVDRSRLDAALLAAAAGAGAEVRTGVRVSELVREEGFVRGVRTGDGAALGARLVVGADGLRSIVLRRLGLLARGPKLWKVGLTAHVAGARLSPGTGELHLRAWGCVGAIEVEPGLANVVVIVDGPHAGRLRAGGRAVFDAAIREVPGLAGGRRVAEVRATGPFDWPTRDVVADGALLVGDAAGYYDPFTGQGIYRALRGGRLAAEWIDRALTAGTASAAALRGYARDHQRVFGPGQRVQRAIEAVTSRTSLMACVAAGLARAPLLADGLVSLTGDARGGPARGRFRA